MAKQQAENTLADFTFDDGDDVFSNFKGDIEEPPIVTPQKAKSNGNPLPEFPEDDAPPVNIDKVKVDKATPPIPSNQKPKAKVVEPQESQDEEGEEEVPDSFFNFEGGTTEAPPKPKPKAPPKETPKKPKKEEVEEGEDEDELPMPGKDVEDDEEEEEQSAVDDAKYFTNLALDLKDRGTFREVEIDENAELTEDDFFDLQEQEFSVRMDEAFEQFAEDMDDDGKDFIKAKKRGMGTRDFLTKYLAPTFDLPDFDPTNKNHVSRTINHYLHVVEGLEGEELEDRKEWLKNSGKEAVHAQKYFEKLHKIDTARKQNIMAALDQRAKEQEESVQEFNVALAEVLNKTDQVGVFSINKGSRKEIYDAITKPTIKAKKGSYVPKLVARISKILSGATEKDLKDLIALTMIVESDFNLPSLKEEVETQVTKEAKARIGKKQPKPSTGRARRELADFF